MAKKSPKINTKCIPSYVSGGKNKVAIRAMQNIISKATNTQSHTASHTHTHTHIMVVLAEAYDGRLLTCQILIRMWRLSLATCLRVKRRRDSKIKWLITVSHLNTTDIRESLISVNFHSASILECKSNYHSHEQCRLPHIQGMWQTLSPSYESPHLLDIWEFDYILDSAASTDGSAQRNGLDGYDWVADGPGS